MEFIETARQGIKSLITRKEPPPLEILNEQLQYIRKYKEKIGKDDVLTIINTPHYELLAPYFGLKLFDGNHQAQRELLKVIANTLKSASDYQPVKERVSEFLHKGYQVSEVSPNKLSRVALWGPSHVQRRAEEVVHEVEERREVPAVIAYSGLFALKPVIQSMNPGDKSYIVFPNAIETEELPGYVMVATPEEIIVQDATKQDLLGESRVALIDDTTHTGETLQQVSSLFPQASVHNATLFVT